MTATAGIDSSSNETIPVVAREATGDEHHRLYDEHARLYPEFAAYPSKVSRLSRYS